MVNNIRINLKALQCNNLSQNGTNLSVNSRNSSLNDANLSLISNITNMVAKLEEAIKNRLFLGSQKKGCNRGVYPFSSGFLVLKNIVKQVFTTEDNKRYYRVLSKLISGRASRNLLAFFVPDDSVDPQIYSNKSDIALSLYSKESIGWTTISMASHLPTDYDGLTLQNKIVFGRICGAVSNKTESKTCHPIPLLYSVTHTQNLLGAIHHG